MYTCPSITSAPDLHLPVLVHIDGRVYDNNSHTSTPLTPPHDDKQDDDDTTVTATSMPPLTPPCDNDRTMTTGPRHIKVIGMFFFWFSFHDTSFGFR
jgi:hypothetical protein